MNCPKCKSPMNKVKAHKRLIKDGIHDGDFWKDSGKCACGQFVIFDKEEFDKVD